MNIRTNRPPTVAEHAIRRSERSSRRPPADRARVRSAEPGVRTDQQIGRPCRPADRAASGSPRSTGGAGATSRPTGAATGACGSSSPLFVFSLFAEFIANDKPIVACYKGELLFPVLGRLSGIKVRRLPRRHRLQGPGRSSTRSRRTAGRSGRRSATPTIRSTRTIRASRTPTASAWAFPGRRRGRRSAVRAMRPPTQHRALSGDRQPQLARHRRPGPRRAGAR